MINPTELNNQTLYFEMLIREGENKPIQEIKGVTKLHANPSCVSIDWLDRSNAARAHSVLFHDEEVKQFVPNESGRKFDVEGKSYIPAFIYIQKRP